MIRLLLDQGLPRSSAVFLRESGIDALHVGECALACASDGEILAWAGREARTVVTLDADFHALLALSGASRPSVVRVRIEGLKGEAMARLLIDVAKRIAVELSAGAMAVVTDDGRLRLKRLPVIRTIA